VYIYSSGQPSLHINPEHTFVLKEFKAARMSTARTTSQSRSTNASLVGDEVTEDKEGTDDKLRVFAAATTSWAVISDEAYKL
jgi:hypothetical protein